jgi:predicted transcriptional regulator
MKRPIIKNREKYKLARELRKQGLYITEIGKRLNISYPTISLWVKDIRLNEEQQSVLKEQRRELIKNGINSVANKRRQKRNNSQQSGRTKAKDLDWLHIAGCMLYWAEGSKPRGQARSMCICNSDPYLLKLFVRFLIESLNIPKEKIYFRIQQHEDSKASVVEAEKYWTEKLNLLPSNIRKTTVIKKSKSKNKRKEIPMGTCSVYVNDIQILQHILGAIQEYASFTRNYWLDYSDKYEPFYQD